MSIWLKDIKDQNVLWSYRIMKLKICNLKMTKDCYDKIRFEIWKQSRSNELHIFLSLSQNYVHFSVCHGFHAFPNSWFTISMSGIFGPERNNWQKNENSYRIFIQECIFMWIRTGSIKFSIHIVYLKLAYSQSVFSIGSHW